MKQGKPFIAFVMTAMFVVLLIYLGVYAFRAFQEPYRTTLVYAYTAVDSVGGRTACWCRDEVVFPGQSGIVELTRSEGEKVGVGQTVALVYRDTPGQADQAQIQSLTQEIQLLQYAVGQSGSVESAARLDEEILQSMVSIRSSAALGDYNDLEDQIREVKSDILKRGYTYGDGLTAADLTARLQDLNSQLTSLNQRSAARHHPGDRQPVGDFFQPCGRI